MVKVVATFEKLCMAWLLTARLSILVVLAINAQLPVATVTTALSDKGGALFEAITNESVTEILVTKDNYVLSKEAWSVYNEDNPYHLKRDLLLRSTIQPVGQLDFMFLANKVLVGSGVTVTFEQLALRNIRKLGGFSLDFFMGEENSTVILRNVIRVKMVCNPITEAYRSAMTFKSPPPWPPNNVSIIPSVCLSTPNWDNICYSNSMYFANFTFLVKSSDPEAGLAHAGYILHMSNTTRVCDNYITEECIAAMGQDTCVAEMLNNIINATQGFTWTPGAIAGIAIASSAVLVVAVLCCWFRHNILRYLVKLGGKSLQELESTSSPSGGDGTPSLLLPSSTVTHGKQSATQAVRLGVLLGSGSFGRVYRGRWHGTEVAVKIISCTPDELPKVLKEAEVMMQLNHPNIVRAFQCSVWNPAEQQRVLQAAKGGKASASAAQQQPHPARGSTSSTSHPSSSVNQHTSSSQSTSRPAPRDSIVINIMPELVQHQRPSTAAAAAGKVGPEAQAAGGAGSTGAGSSQGALSSGSVPLSGAGAAAAAGSAAGSGSTSSSEAARRLFSKVLDPVQQHQQQQQQQEQRLLGPPTRSRSHEYTPRVVTTPLSSAAHTAVGSSGGPSSSMVHPMLMSFQHEGFSPGSQLVPATFSQASHSAPLEGVSAAAGSAAAAAASSSTAVPALQTAAGIAAATPAAAEAAAAAAYVGSGTGSRSSTAASSSQLTRYSSGPGAIAEGKDGGVWSGIGPWKRSSGSRDATTSSSSTAAALSAESGQQAAASASEPRATAGTDIGEIQPAPGPGSWWRRRGAAASTGSGSSRDWDQAAGSGGKEGGEVLQQQGGDDSSTDEGRKEVQVWLVLELCTGGTLKDAVSLGRLRSDSRLEMAKLLSRLLDAANGMTYLHSKGVLHGDLKAGNVLLQSSMHGSYGYISKISDFGLAATLMDGATHRSTASMGTITHMAPEVLKSGHMSTAADVYSFGIMMWEVFTNQQAHSGLHYGAVVERVVLKGQRPPVPDNMPKEYALLMRNCWDAEASKRPTFAQVIQCLELLLDNLTSDSEGRISEGVEERTSSTSSQGALEEKKEDEDVRDLSGQLLAKQAPLTGSEGFASSSAVGASSGAPGTSSVAAMSRAVSRAMSGPHSGTLSGTTTSGSLSGPGTSSGFQDLEQQQGLLGKGSLLGRMPSSQGSSGGAPFGSGRVQGWSGTVGSGSLSSGQPSTPQAQGAQQRALLAQLRDRTGGSGTAADVEGSQFVQDL